ncbi:MAG: hypothetical protein O7I93_09575, partial [Gemmatimonadetes bacterium]|nr:hypothetical protein [Gemmatimonadota bacterium]
HDVPFPDASRHPHGPSPVTEPATTRRLDLGAGAVTRVPEFYEHRLAWLVPACYLEFELTAVK